jgi:hypothetical protein
LWDQVIAPGVIPVSLFLAVSLAEIG